jgi:hypothetical protein
MSIFNEESRSVIPEPADRPAPDAHENSDEAILIGDGAEDELLGHAPRPIHERESDEPAKYQWLLLLESLPIVGNMNSLVISHWHTQSAKLFEASQTGKVWKIWDLLRQAQGWLVLLSRRVPMNGHIFSILNI